MANFEDITSLEKGIASGQIKDTQIVDVRPENVFQSGHIDTSLNLFYKQVLDGDTNTVKSREEIKELL